MSKSLFTVRRGKHKQRNKKLKQNPNPIDDKNAYVSRHLIDDFKFNYSKAFKNYVLSNEDIDELINFLESKKKHP